MTLADQVTDLRSFQINPGKKIAVYLNLFGEGAGFKRDIDGDNFCDRQLHAGNMKGLEGVFLGGYFIGTDGQVSNGKATFGTAGHNPCRMGGKIGGRDFCSRHNRARGINYGSSQCAVLCEQQSGCDKQD